MHHAEAVGETGDAHLREDELRRGRLRHVPQPLGDRMIQKRALDRREDDVAMDRISNATRTNHRVSLPRTSDGSECREGSPKRPQVVLSGFRTAATTVS